MKSKFSRGKLKYLVNEKFFDKWNPEMAYILGFTYSDGNIYKTSLSWNLQKRDLDILEKINKTLNSSYPILSHRELSLRLRISNQILVDGAIKRGLFPKKNLREKLPEIPKNLLRDFIRGYLDGDGWIVLRTGRNEVNLGFCGCNKEFIGDINKIICRELGISIGKVREKIKITPRGIKSVTYQLEFYSSRAYKIAQWLYGNLGKRDLYLNRKYLKYLKTKKLYKFLHSGGKKIRIIQQKQGKPMRNILQDLYFEKNFDGVQIAEILGVHSSSVYRWLAQNGIKYPIKRNLKHG